LATARVVRTVGNLSPAPPNLVYLYTTFPKNTETFMQREVAAMQTAGWNLRIYSLIGGGGDFRGIAVRRFSMWRLLELLWMIPWIAATRWDVFGVVWHGLWTRRAPGWLNFWENMLGAGFAALHYRELRKAPPDLIHAAWGGAPATAAWMLGRFNGHRYSAAAHAYDIFEYGGDWWLSEKLVEARFVHTSTEMGWAALVARGLRAEGIRVIRRGLEVLPPLKPLRSGRDALRVLCIARLVAKKGLHRQLAIYAAMRAAGITFSARIAGDGPERAALERRRAELGLQAHVSFLGHLAQAEVQAELLWADVLFHTGVVAPSGDRDGLPNVIPEAMAAGVLVVSSPVAGTVEAVRAGETGWLAAVEDPAGWVGAVREIIGDEVSAARVQRTARAWVEAEFDAHRNAAKLREAFTQAIR
jgi:glycosyltransferase involved in cell wall biosynthesis